MHIESTLMTWVNLNRLFAYSLVKYSLQSGKLIWRSIKEKQEENKLGLLSEINLMICFGSCVVMEMMIFLHPENDSNFPNENNFVDKIWNYSRFHKIHRLYSVCELKIGNISLSKGTHKTSEHCCSMWAWSIGGNLQHLMRFRQKGKEMLGDALYLHGKNKRERKGRPCYNTIRTPWMEHSKRSRIIKRN